MAKGKGTRGVIGQFTSTRGMLTLAITGAAILFVHNKLQKSAQDSTKRDSLANKVAGTLGYSGAGISA